MVAILTKDSVCKIVRFVMNKLYMHKDLGIGYIVHKGALWDDLFSC